MTMFDAKEWERTEHFSGGKQLNIIPPYRGNCRHQRLQNFLPHLAPNIMAPTPSRKGLGRDVPYPQSLRPREHPLLILRPKEASVVVEEGEEK